MTTMDSRWCLICGQVVDMEHEKFTVLTIEALCGNGPGEDLGCFTGTAIMHDTCRVDYRVRVRQT
jgi:hypothetical protein